MKAADPQCPADMAQCPHARQSAEFAVKKVFAILGVDVDDPEKVEEFRMDLRFGRSMRRATDRGMLAFVGVVAVGIAAALWAGVVTKLGGGHG